GARAVMSNALEPILSATRVEVERRRTETPLDQLDARSDQIRPFLDALTRPGLSVIAEFKRRSPSAGELRADADVAEVVRAYERGGAAALSVLTEGPHFGGSLDDLRAARAASSLPILRKDFVVDPYQLHEARAAGADAVLLIVAALPLEELAALHARALELGLDPLVEVHDADELAGALEVGAELIGVNNRDLRDFTVDVARTSLLVRQVPAGVTVVSESGIASAMQVRALGREGVSAVLVGESLMRAEDPEAALRALVG
ncbi:MAG TPA: indole-3-glycerol phosphate synthase TrpC, partial [Solirubrobacteraceae bacterium]|nr:indole-3-glycerol phosphate synthase TrpC [Solirubrobacteraceae bacterium]